MSINIAELRTVNLQVNAPPGVEISISRGPFEEVKRGFNSLNESLPEGIYIVRWHSASAVREKSLRLKAGQPAIQLDYDRSEDIRQAGKLQDAIIGASSLVGPPSVVLFAQYPKEEKPGRLPSDINVRPTRNHQADPKKTRLDLLEGQQGACFQTEPGAHVLRYKNVDNIVLEQSIEVYRGRTTVVIAPLVRASRPVRIKKEARFRSRLGVDPSKIVVFSVPFETNQWQIEDTMRLATKLLEMLTKGAIDLDPQLSAAVLVENDPCLAMYATAILLASASASETFRLTNQHTLEVDDVSRARQLLDAQNDQTSDKQCAEWRLALDGWSENETPFSLLETPPMLERSWQWGSVWSVTNPGVGTESKEIASAAISRLPIVPWLVWRGNARASIASRSSALQDDLESLTKMFTETVNSVREGVLRAAGPNDPPKSFEFPNIDLSQLSSKTTKLAMSAARLALDSKTSSEMGLLEGLASALKTPINIVADQMKQALSEVDRARKSAESYGEMFSADPHKGKFGGSATRNDYSLSLTSWKKSNDPEFLILDLTVNASAKRKPTGAVTFYLHPTFNPATEVVRWRGQESVCRCYAMGGFTLGVEIDDGTRLELDIALDERLPDWFRSR